MLVVSRKLGEKVFIGRDICVTVPQIKGNRIALGIQAPGTVPILRGELAEWLEQSTPPDQHGDDAAQTNENNAIA